MGRQQGQSPVNIAVGMSEWFATLIGKRTDQDRIRYYDIVRAERVDSRDGSDGHSNKSPHNISTNASVSAFEPLWLSNVMIILQDKVHKIETCCLEESCPPRMNICSAVYNLPSISIPLVMAVHSPGGGSMSREDWL